MVTMTIRHLPHRYVGHFTSSEVVNNECSANRCSAVMLMALTHLIRCFVSVLMLSLSSRACWVSWSLWELKPENDRKFTLFVSTLFLICSYSSLTDLKVFGSGEEMKYVFCA